MFRATTQSSSSSFYSAAPKPISQPMQLGNVQVDVPLVEAPDHSGYFRYFKLNDQPALVEEGARLIAERMKSSGVANPFFVTPEASTLALAHVLRTKYGINGLTLYKTKQLNDVDPIGIVYDTVTSDKPKQLYFDKNKLPQLQDKNIFILDSVCTTGGTIRAVFQLLVKAGLSPKNMVEATMLFNEGEDRKILTIDASTQLPIHRFAVLPFIPNPNKKPAPVLFFAPKAKPKFTVVIASDNPVKVDAVKMAVAKMYADSKMDFEFKPVKTSSGVSEQPFDQETEAGASQRLIHAEQLAPNADLYVAVENGIYQVDGRYVDKAIVKLKMKDQGEKTLESVPVEFPKQYVEEAKRIGFAKTTVGECLFKAGVVQNAKDPHANLGDKVSRQVILCDAIQEGVGALRQGCSSVSLTTK